MMIEGKKKVSSMLALWLHIHEKKMYKTGNNQNKYTIYASRN